MVKFKDSFYLMLFVLGLNFASSLTTGMGILGFVFMVALWAIFWNWFGITFISVSYVREQLAKDKQNDNKNSGGSNT